MQSMYRGWKITYNINRPVTGKYVAERHGVTVCATTRVAIERMVDARIDELL